MRKEWRLIYKCRLCGRIYGDGAGLTQERADSVINEKVFHGKTIQVHGCALDRFGVADLQGAAEYPSQR